MGNSFNLIRNEWMKLLQRKSTWIMAIILVVAVFGIVGLLRWDYSNNDTPAQSPTWEEQLQQQISAYETRKEGAAPSSNQYKDAVEQIELAQYRIDHELAPLEGGTYWSTVNNSVLFFSFLVLFVIIVASGIIANEFSKGTIKLLAIRPATRGKLLYSKYVTVLLFSVAITGLLLVCALVSGLFFPFDSYTYLTWNGETVSEWPAIVEVLQAYVYSMVNLVVMGTVAFMIATLFRSNGLAIGLSMFLSFATYPAMNLLQGYEWAKYLLFAHNEFAQHLTQPLFDVTPAFSLFIIIIYLIIFHVLTYISFKKRDIAV